MNKATIKIKKDEDNPEPLELLAKSIIQVSDGFEKISRSGLTDRALIVLLQDIIGSTKINKQQIGLVLDNLPRLKAWYIKK